MRYNADGLAQRKRLIKAPGEAFEFLFVEFVETGWSMGTLASVFAGGLDEIETEELFAEITLIEGFTEDGFVGCL